MAIGSAGTVRRSVCPLDCPDRCSLVVEVDGDRVVAIDGSDKNPMTDDYICAKVRKFHQRVHGPLRIGRPALRVGPKGPGARFEPVSWDRALSVIAERWSAIAAESGWEAVLPFWYAGSNGWLTGGGMDQRLWNRLGTTKITRTFCAANTGAAVKAVMGRIPSADPLDLDDATVAVLWGCNPSSSGIHLVPHLRAVQERGGKLIVVDPRRTPLAKQADLHLAPLPGTDVVLAMAMARVAFEEGLADGAFLDRWVADGPAYRAAVAEWTPERAGSVCGVPADRIVEAARLYAGGQRSLIRIGWGLERNRNGTDGVRAVLALPAVCGKMGVRGSGWVLSTSSGYGIDPTDWQQVPGSPPARTVNMSELGKVLDEVRDPPIRSVYVYDCNPVATAPDQLRVTRNLARDDLFVVVHEQVHTDTVDYANVVLPATTFLEHHELVRSYGGYLVQWSEPAIPPVGEAWPNHRVMVELAARLGLGDEPAFRVTDVELAGEMARMAGLDFDQLRETGVFRVEPPVQLNRARPGSITLCGALGPPRFRPPPADPDQPLILVSPSSTRGITSTGFETLPPGTATVALNPDDARARGIGTGDRVRVHNWVGELVLLAAIDDAVRPGVASIPKGLWRSGTLDGHTSNAVVPGHVDEIGGGACYNDARVEISLVRS